MLGEGFRAASRPAACPPSSDTSWAQQGLQAHLRHAPGTYRGQPYGVPGLGRDPDAGILAQDATGSLSARLGHPS